LAGVAAEQAAWAGMVALEDVAALEGAVADKVEWVGEAGVNSAVHLTFYVSG